MSGCWAGLAAQGVGRLREDVLWPLALGESQLCSSGSGKGFAHVVFIEPFLEKEYFPGGQILLILVRFSALYLSFSFQRLALANVEDEQSK